MVQTDEKEWHIGKFEFKLEFFWGLFAAVLRRLEQQQDEKKWENSFLKFTRVSVYVRVWIDEILKWKIKSMKSEWLWRKCEFGMKNYNDDER